MLKGFNKLHIIQLNINMIFEFRHSITNVYIIAKYMYSTYQTSCLNFLFTSLCDFMNELMNDRLTLFMETHVNAKGRTLKRNAYDEIYTECVRICLTTASNHRRI